MHKPFSVWSNKCVSARACVRNNLWVYRMIWACIVPNCVNPTFELHGSCMALTQRLLHAKEFALIALLWATMRENVPSNMYTRRRLKSACAFARSLIRVRYSHMKKLYILGHPKCVQWRFWSDCAYAQADLNLRCAHMSQSTFSDVEARRCLC